MSDKNIKVIRGQLRQIAKDLLNEEMATGIRDQIAKVVNDRLNAIDAYVKAQLEEMQERSRETQDYVTRKLALAEVRTVPAAAIDASPSQE